MRSARRRHARRNVSGTSGEREGRVGEIITPWIAAEVTLLPREGGKPQRPPCIFRGYRNSNMGFERPDGDGFELPSGGAALFPMDQDQLDVGQTGLVYLQLWGEATIASKLRMG